MRLEEGKGAGESNRGVLVPLPDNLPYPGVLKPPLTGISLSNSAKNAFLSFGPLDTRSGCISPVTPVLNLDG